jgi:hypothetical protein
VNVDEPGYSARNGDLVRAVTNDRDARLVQGLLKLNWVASLGYVQVFVQTTDGLADVRPSSVRVIRRSPVTSVPEEGPAELAEALRGGVLPDEWDQAGGTWADMEGRLDAMIVPLIQAGWRVAERHRETSWEHGDSVLVDLARGAETVEFELYCDDRFVAWAMTDIDNLDDSEDSVPAPPLWSVDDSNPQELAAKFRAEGWT